MSRCTPRDESAPALAPTPVVIIEEPELQDCSNVSVEPEGNIRLRSYCVHENFVLYPPSGDIHNEPTNGKFVPKLDLISSIFPARNKILELLRPEDPGKDTLEAIVRPTPRRGLLQPYDEDTRRFLQRAVQTSALPCFSQQNRTPSNISEPKNEDIHLKQNTHQTHDFKKERSLAEELREAEEGERSGAEIRREFLREFRKRGGGIREAMERDRLGKLALAVEEDEEMDEGYGLTAAAKRLDALLVESRSLHEELAGIHQDIQTQCARAWRCSAAARALAAESRALRYLDDVVALLRGDLAAAHRTTTWPFALGPRQPGKNYIV